MWNWIDTFIRKYPGKLSVSFCGLSLGQFKLVFCFCDGLCTQSFRKKSREQTHGPFFRPVWDVCMCCMCSLCCSLYPSHPIACWLPAEMAAKQEELQQTLCLHAQVFEKLILATPGKVNFRANSLSQTSSCEHYPWSIFLTFFSQPNLKKTLKCLLQHLQ